MEAMLALAIGAAALYIAWRVAVFVVGALAPRHFVAVAYVREQMRRQGLDWRAFTPREIDAVAAQAIADATSDQGLDRVDMADLIRAYVAAAARAENADPDSREARIWKNILREGEARLLAKH